MGAPPAALILLLMLLEAAGGFVGIRFTGSSVNMTVSQGQGVKLNCSLEGMEDPEIQWMKDGEAVQSIDQMYIPVDEDHWISFLSLKGVERPHAGRYWCEAGEDHERVMSEDMWLTIEGVPYFTQEPEDVAVFSGVPFNVTCAAIGPPDPVLIVWWLGDSKVDRDPEDSPSILTVPGIRQKTFFSCEAHNERGLSSSRTAVAQVKVLPLAPSNLSITKVSNASASISWTPGNDGFSPLQSCTVQVTESFSTHELPSVVVSVPPFAAILQDLEPCRNYSIRVQCANEIGSSPFSNWVKIQTQKSVPSIAPRNVRVIHADSVLVLEWEEENPDLEDDVLLGYRLQWAQDNVTQGEMLVHGTIANLTAWDSQKDFIARVCILNSAGCGPWSEPLFMTPRHEAGRQGQLNSGMSWVPLVLGILTALVTVVAMTLIFLRRRRKETRFGTIFGSVLGHGGPVVHFTAARTFNRRGPELMEATLDNVGISNDLKGRLQDLLIQPQQFTLGRTLGKGEFGSVREALLKLEDGSFQKVAVKMLKADIFTSSDIEEFLREAAFMKEFNHPNVSKLIGVSLRSRAKGRLPVPMVILPFMKYGDLHTYMLMSRIGEEPFTVPIQTLIRFMVEISSGMEYLSSKNFIHRDLASRNCMLNENMSVCVADFGLSKKIYSGDYYRQGSASKLPVKWLALESLADNVYTVSSDVWAFGITMWEIVTLGQTPYAGIENCEIYNYLTGGNRLKQPPDCLDDLYEMMCRCWQSEPKNRPNFTTLKRQLEAIWGRLSLLSASQDELYINIGEGLDASGDDPPFADQDEVRESGAEASASAAFTSDYRYIMNPVCLTEDDERHSSTHAGEIRSLLLDDEEEDLVFEEDSIVIDI
ncbi:tyrosine-protein kinase receptor TYRO3 [Lissotriton helveticus]